MRAWLFSFPTYIQSLIGSRSVNTIVLRALSINLPVYSKALYPDLDKSDQHEVQPKRLFGQLNKRGALQDQIGSRTRAVLV